MFNTPVLKVELANLGAADQIAYRREIIIEPGSIVYRFHGKLPTSNTPGIADFPWVTLEFQIPECYRGRITALADPSKQVSLPMFTIEANGTVTTAVTIKEPQPVNPGRSDVYLGLDYGLTTPYTAATILWDDITDTGTVGRSYELRTRDTLTPKIMRLKNESSLLQSKIYRLELLAAGAHNPAPLQTKIVRLQLEKTRVDRKAQNLRNTNSHRVAGWVERLCDIESAGTVVLEDLSTLEPQLSKQLNKMMTESTRSATSTQIEHRMARKGVGTETVFARGTSQTCPKCLNKTGTHTENYKLMTCPECGLLTGRDKAAGQMIGMRGAQKQARRNKTRTVAEDRPVQVRNKTGPTPKQPRKVKPSGGTLKCLRTSKPKPHHHRKRQLPLSTASSTAQESVGTAPQETCVQRNRPDAGKPHNVMLETPHPCGSQKQTTG